MLEYTTKAVLLDEQALNRSITRIAHEIIEHNKGLDNVALVGIVRRGALLSKRLAAALEKIEGKKVEHGILDISFYRDDFGTRISPVVHTTSIPFNVEQKNIVLVDDVLYTGRTIRAALDALHDHGRPACVQLAVMVDRGHRELPIRADYVGKNVPSSKDEHIKVFMQPLDDKTSVEIIEYTR